MVKCAQIISMLLLLLASGCAREQLDDCITSTGPQRTEVRYTGHFHTVDLDDRIDLVLEAREHGTASVEAGRNLLGQVHTEVEDGILKIRNRNKCNWVRSFKPRITVRVPVQDVKQLVLHGTGDIHCTDTIRHDEFRVEQWGAMGTAELLLDVGALYIGLHTGAGDMVLKGRVGQNANFYSDMLGSIDARGLHTPLLNINNQGIGDFRCWAVGEMNVAIRDAGDVYYRGEPLQLNSQITGTGRLIRME
jgi:hypothetical protein